MCKYRFRWVACQLDYLEGLGKIGRRNALDELPPTLNASYDRILVKILSRRGNNLAKDIVRMTLHWLCLDGHNLKVAQLCEALSLALEQGKRSTKKTRLVDEQEIARYCSSLIRKNDDGDKFELAHFTVKEYLYTIDISSKLGEFRYSESEAAESLMVASLECILLPNFSRRLPPKDTKLELAVLQRIGNHLFYYYAVSFWTHQPQLYEAPSVRKLLKELFGQRKKVNFQNWLFHYVFSMAGKFRVNEEQDENPTQEALLEQDINPLHVAASLSIPWLCEWLLQSGANVNATGSYKLSAIYVALIGPDIFWMPMHYLPRLLKEYPRTMDDVADLGATIEVLLRNGIEITQTPVCSIGTLALEVSAAIEHEIPFTLLLKYAPEKCLTQDTLDKMKVLFDENEPEIDHPLHEILQEVLDMERQSGEEGYIEVAVSFVQELLRSGTTWDTYNHYKNQFLPAHINNKEASRYIEYAAAQNRVEDITRLFEDGRFENYTTHEVWSQAFMLAAEFDSSDVVRVLFGKGFKPLDKDAEGNTIWHVAARYDSINVLHALFDTCLNVQDILGAVSENGRTPLAEAMFCSRVKVAELLLDRCHNDPTHFRSRPPVLHLSVGMGSQVLFQKLLAKNLPEMDKALDGSTPLHFVGNRCNFDFLRVLTALYDTNEQRQDGKVAFQIYMSSVLDSGLPGQFPTNQLTSIIKMLAPTNCNVHQNNSDIHIWSDFCQQLGLAGNLECTARKSACFLSLVTAFRDASIIDSYEQRYQQSALVPLLENLESLDFKAGLYRWEANFVRKAIDVLRDTSANRPLMARDHPAPIALLIKAIQQDYHPLVRELIDIGTPVHPRVHKTSPLEMACAAGSCKIFGTVLDRADLSIVNGAGDTDPEIICRLIASTQGINRASDFVVSLKLSRALDYGASPDARIAADTAAGCPAIVMAARREKYNRVDILRQAGADVLARCQDGWDLAFHYIAQGRLDLLRDISNKLEAASYDWLRGVQLRLQEGSWRPDLWYGCTALHIATLSGSIETMSYVLQDGRCANVNVISAESCTPLHLASYLGDIKAIEFLLAHGAAVNTLDNKGNLPIDLAFMKGVKPAVELLRQLGSAEPKGGSGNKLDGAGDDSSNNNTKSRESDSDNNLNKDTGKQYRNKHQLRYAAERLTLMDIEFLKCLELGDLEGCQTLVACGYPLDRPIPSCGRCDVLTYAVLIGRGDIVAWLLSIRIMPKICRCTKHKAPSTIHVAARTQNLCTPCLNQLLDRALEAGYGWQFYPLNPLHLASLQRSTSVLEVILDHIADHIEAYWFVIRGRR